MRDLVAFRRWWGDSAHHWPSSHNGSCLPNLSLRSDEKHPCTTIQESIARRLASRKRTAAYDRNPHEKRRRARTLRTHEITSTMPLGSLWTVAPHPLLHVSLVGHGVGAAHSSRFSIALTQEVTRCATSATVVSMRGLLRSARRASSNAVWLSWSMRTTWRSCARRYASGRVVLASKVLPSLE